MSWREEPNADVRAVLSFWFEEAGEKKWYAKDEGFDALVGKRFGALHGKAARAELFSWRKTATGRLAEIILLDQFSRNMFRGTAKAFHYDPLALVLAQEAVAAGADQKVEPRLRGFFYLPYMHSESAVIHEVALTLYAFDEGGLEWEKKHKAIIDRFGRYPHRNAMLGRESTPEEVAFLEEPGSSF